MRKTLFLMALLASRAEAQGPGFELGRLFTEPAATTYRIGFTAPISGPLSGGIHGTYMDAEGAIGNLWGAGADLALFKGGRLDSYLVGGVSGGMVTQGSETFWGSWSGGLGYELFPFRALSSASRPVSCPRPRRLSRRGAGVPPRRAETVAPARAGNQDRDGTGAVLTSYHRSHPRDTSRATGSPRLTPRPLRPWFRRHSMSWARRISGAGTAEGRIRLLGTHPLRLRQARRRSSAHQRRAGSRRRHGRQGLRADASGRHPDLLQPERSRHHPRRPLYRGPALHSQRFGRSSNQRAGSGRYLQAAGGISAGSESGGWSGGSAGRDQQLPA